MKKFALVTLLPFAVFCSVGLFAKTGATAFSTSGKEITQCPAPPPQTLFVTSVTPNSISLAWTTNISNLFFKIDIYDQTTSTWLASVYTTNLSYTFNNLASDHCFLFYASASYCAQGPFGQAITAEDCTGIIIIDDIYAFTECSPGTIAVTASAGTGYNICVDRSTNNDPMLLNNCSRATFEYAGRTCEINFGFTPATDNNKLMIYLDTTTAGFELVPVNGTVPNAAICNFLGTGAKILTIDYSCCTPISWSGSHKAFVILTFNVTVSNFRFCDPTEDIFCPQPVCNSSSFLSDTGNSWQDAAQGTRLPATTTESALHISPNPFVIATNIEYTLNATGPASVRIYDVTGRLVQTILEETQLEAGKYTNVISGNDMPVGVYFLQIKTGEKQSVYRLIKQE